MRDKGDLRQRQSLPLNAKILMSQARIREWYEHFNGDVCISFSGGKDSTVLAHLVHERYPDVPLVFANTGLEYPEIQAFARKMGAVFLRPKMAFSEVISRYGYPIISKENAEAIYYARRIRNGADKRKYVEQKLGELNGQRPRNDGAEEEKTGRIYGAKRIQLLGGDVKNKKWEDWRRASLQGIGQFSTKKSIFNKEKWLPLCNGTAFNITHMCCAVMKKDPLQTYQKKYGLYPFVGTLAEESKLREQAWIKHGCNAFDGKKKTSQPLSFWLEQDILRYILENDLEIASVYGDIVVVDPDGFEYDPNFAIGKLKCTGCSRTGCVFCGFGLHLEKGETRFQRLARTHPKQYEYCMRGGQWVDNPAYDPTAPEYDGEWKNWNPKKIWVPSKEGLGMKKVFDDCNELYGKDFIRYE